MLRFNDTTALGAPVGNSLMPSPPHRTATPRSAGGCSSTAARVPPPVNFVVTAVEAKINYHNLTITVVSASVPDPFPNGAAIVVDWTPSATRVMPPRSRWAPPQPARRAPPAEVNNIGTATTRCSISPSPRACRAKPFAPTYVVPDLAGRDAYDDEPVFNEDGSRMSVLVESDSSNGGSADALFQAKQRSRGVVGWHLVPGGGRRRCGQL